MAESKQLPKQLHEVLVLGPPAIYKIYDDDFSQRFQSLKPFDSPIPNDQFLAAKGGSVQAVICFGGYRITAEILGQLPSIRVIVTCSAGVNHIDLLECRRRGISVANAGTVFLGDVADAAVGLLIDVMRRISASDWFVRGRLWPLRVQ